jgi:hypothetical protein
LARAGRLRLNGDVVARARKLYFTFLSLSVVLFGAAAVMTPLFGPSAMISLWHFVVVGLAFGASAATWGTAVMIASVHKVTWPIALSTGLVVTSCVLWAATWARHIF